MLPLLGVRLPQSHLQQKGTRSTVSLAHVPVESSASEHLTPESDSPVIPHTPHASHLSIPCHFYTPRRYPRKLLPSPPPPAGRNEVKESGYVLGHYGLFQFCLFVCNVQNRTAALRDLKSVSKTCPLALL